MRAILSSEVCANKGEGAPSRLASAISFAKVGLAELPHTAPPLDTSVEAFIGIRMKSTWTRNPSIEDGPQWFPVGLSPLTSTT